MKFKNALSLWILVILFQIPNISFAQHQSPLDLTLRYLEQNKKELGLTATDIQHYRVSDLYMSKHNGVTHVYLNQEHNNVKVLNAIINANILPDGKILSVGNRFIPNLQEKVNGSTPSIEPVAAVQQVINEFDLATNAPLRLHEQVSDQHFVFDHDQIALEPITVKLVYQKMENKTVRLAWMVQFYQLDAKHWWNAKIDAQTGEMIAHRDQVIHCSFAAHGGTCTEVGHTHQKAQKNDTPHLGRFNQVAVVNSYNVFPMPIQSPNHGDRELVQSPADPLASPNGWHDTNGVPGAEFTITRGNNVHAYHDIFSINASSGDEPDGGATLDFDYPLDLTPALPYGQVDPAVTNLFYWNNIIHDLWYHYGFDEASGNFQVNNYGNGGIANDPVRAEALDGGGTNNANFGTGEDGSGARMQMYIWTSDPLPPGGGAPPLVVLEPTDVAGEYPMEQGGFGGALPNPPIMSEIILADDGVGTGSDVCEDIINGADLSGKIAMIDRGDCEFGSKSLKAENAGAIAVIICNNVTGGTIAMGAGAEGGQVTIPAVMVSLEDCNTIKMGLAEGLVVELGGDEVEIPMPGPSGFDGDFDNGIIAHEYGHGITIRMTGGPSTGGCLGNDEQAGEGWSDWFGLVMTTNSSNNSDENRGVGTFAIGEPTNGVGIREYPYSRDMTVNPHTYADVPNVAIPHGVGSVWCAMIWDLYWDLIDEVGWDDDIYGGTGGNNIAMQLVMDGVKLQGCSPSFIESRQGILDADEANYGGAYKCLIWETFARRGLGWSASTGGNEAFDMPAFCTPLQVEKTAVGDAIAGETITYTVTIANNIESIIPDVVVTDDFPQGTSYVDGSLSCPNGSVSGNELTIDIGDLASGTSITCTYQLMVDANPFSFVELADDVENGEDLWSVTTAIGDVNWETNSNSYQGDLAWFAADIETQSDQYLALAETVTLTGDNPALAFWHWYDTEATWDGGVVEVSTNGGATWFDLGNNMIKNGYNSTIEVNPDSPISGQSAFSGNSDQYIQTIVDLTNFSGDDIMVRFRFGSDAAVGGNGWYIDNVEFFGDLYSITNTACISAPGNNEACDDATTVIFSDGSSATNDLENDLDITLSPNPSNGKFVLNMSGTDFGTTNIQVMSVDGKQLESTTLDRSIGSFEFDLSDYESGIYLLQIQTNDSQTVKKIVIQ